MCISAEAGKSNRSTRFPWLRELRPAAKIPFCIIFLGRALKFDFGIKMGHEDTYYSEKKMLYQILTYVVKKRFQKSSDKVGGR